MSFRAVLWALTTPLKAREKWVLVALADHADGNGKCWPSMETLSRKTGYGDRKTVRAAITNLEELGYLSKKGRVVGVGLQTSHMYHLNLDHLHKPLEDVEPAGDEIPTAGEEIPTGGHINAGPPAEYEIPTRGPAGDLVPGVGDEIPTNQSMNHSSLTKRSTTRARDDFDLEAEMNEETNSSGSVAPTEDDFFALLDRWPA